MKLIGYLLFSLSISIVLTNGNQLTKEDLKNFFDFDCLNPQVTVQVFSAKENPSWKINLTELIHIPNLLQDFNQYSSPMKLSQRIMGYEGFILRCSNEKQIFIHGLNSIEKVLLESGRQYLSSTIIEHINEHLGQTISSNSYRTLTRINCDRVPIKGSDQVPIYNPLTANGGCFIQKQSKNNCYAYGTNIVTNTFPQPGRYNGKKLSSITCESVRKAAVLDGLVYNGTTFPQAHPHIGHFVALLIWPNADYHWIRKDANGYWSHKPGAGPITNRDNTGSLIVNPIKSNLSPWKLFCGYYIAQPSKINIR